MRIIMLDLDVFHRIVGFVKAGGAKQTLFEALGAEETEAVHSDYLAWLLSPSGPLSRGWLLASLMRWCGVEEDLGPPVRVEREVTQGGERADIVVEWHGFRLVIENKVNSSEGREQCRRYLETFSLTEPSEGRLLFLTRKGIRPHGVPPELAKCLQTMAYTDLRKLVDEARHKEDSVRGLAMALEYERVLARLEGGGTNMEKPIVSDADLYVTGHIGELDEAVRNVALKTREYVHWLMNIETAARLADLWADQPSVSHGFGYTWLFRKPSWNAGGLHFGLSYSAEKRLGTRLLPHYGHIVGVRVDSPADEADTDSEEGRRTLVRQLHEVLRTAWQSAAEGNSEDVAPLGRDAKFSTSNSYWPVYWNAPWKGEQHWDEWGRGMSGKLEALARLFTKDLDAFALSLRRGSGK